MGIGPGSEPERTNARLFKATLVGAFAAIYIIWGSTYLAIRYAVETISPFLRMGLRSVAAGTILLSLSYLRREDELKREHLLGIVIIGISFFVICHGLLAWSEQRIPSGYAAVLLASIPLWSAMIEGAVIKEGV
jgi:drug/metabolite transporter (DMT)-like permease